MENSTNQMKVELGSDVAEGTYSNFVIISHSDSEFILDFARIIPGKPKAKIHSRVIMNPKNCKLFLHALTENVKKFESKFGNISVDTGQGRRIGIQPSTDTEQ